MSGFGRLADAWFRPKRFELGGRLYEWLGVRRFKRCLLGLARPHPDRADRPAGYRLPERSLAGMRAFESRTRRNEMLHLLVMMPSLLVLSLGGVGSGAITVLFVLIFVVNFYPFILQRYNRIRLLRVLAERTGRIARHAARRRALDEDAASERT